MSLLAPLYMLGLAAISLPLVFHLVRRMPRGRQPFSSLMFLAASPPRLTRKSRLDDLLLLLLRGLALGLLALAFARPFVRAITPMDVTEPSGRMIAVVVDTSASMRRSGLWEKAVAEAAKVIESASLAAAFLEIAARREAIVAQVSSLIVNQGEKPDQEGSAEAAVHRWWIRVRAQVTDEDFKATLEECVRGEQELARTIQAALDKGHLIPAHAAILTDAADELLLSLQTFKSAIDR